MWFVDHSWSIRSTAIMPLFSLEMIRVLLLGRRVAQLFSCPGTVQAHRGGPGIVDRDRGRGGVAGTTATQGFVSHLSLHAPSHNAVCPRQEGADEVLIRAAANIALYSVVDVDLA
jgi:hypothetical protein